MRIPPAFSAGGAWGGTLKGNTRTGVLIPVNISIFDVCSHKLGGVPSVNRDDIHTVSETRNVIHHLPVMVHILKGNKRTSTQYLRRRAHHVALPIAVHIRQAYVMAPAAGIYYLCSPRKGGRIEPPVFGIFIQDDLVLS